MLWKMLNMDSSVIFQAKFLPLFQLHLELILKFTVRCLEKKKTICKKMQKQLKQSNTYQSHKCIWNTWASIETFFY